MRQIRDFIGQELIWIPAKLLKDQYELYAGKTMLATLDISNWSSKAIATVAEGILEIRRGGILAQMFSVYPAGSGTALATFKRGWTGGGTLTLADARIFTWKTKGVWVDAQRYELIHCKGHAFSRKVDVMIKPGASSLPELSLLVILGLYLTVIFNRDVAAAQSMWQV